MSERFYGSICVTDIVEFANKKHSAFSKADNGKIYANVTVWLNDEKDKYGNIMALQLTPKKELRELDGQPYIGNMKESESKPISARDAGGLTLPSDIESAPKKEGVQPQDTPEIKEPINDLPF